MTGRGKARLSAEKVAEIFMDSDSENDLFDDNSDDSSAERDPARGRGQGRAAPPDPGWAPPWSKRVPSL
jgi:hypothetical protein